MKPQLVAVIAIALLASVALLGWQGASSAGWQLENESSQLNFVSTKAKDVGEVHRFTHLTGSVSEEGVVVLEINLASVDTLIPLRDERMRNMLFQVGTFPTASLTGQVDLEAIRAMPVGSSARQSLTLNLDLHGKTQPVDAEVNVARLSQNQIQVSSFKPVIVNAASFDLLGGIELLREAAGLPGISAAVPVTFVLTYRNG